MSEICSDCGLPKDLCVCETIAKEQQKIKIKTERRKFGRTYTIVEGIRGSDVDLDELVRKLKARVAAGGTSKEGRIELQGNHVRKVYDLLVELGFSKELIEI